MTTTSPALPASHPTILSRLAGLRRRIPTVVLFAAVSFTGWSVDYALVLILNSLTDSVLYAVVGARIVSCTLGFLLNRRLFGAGPETFWPSAGGYAAVQGGVAATSYAGISVRQLPGPVPPRLPGPGAAAGPGHRRLRVRDGAEAQDWASRMRMTSWTRSRRSSLVRIRVTFFLTESGARTRR